MAGTITYKASLKCTNGSYFNQQRDYGSLTADQATIGSAGDTQIIGTSAEAIAYGDLVAPRWCFLRNLDTTNFIKIGPDNSGLIEMIRLMPGEACVFPIGPSVVLKAQADTAPCKLEKFIVET